MIDDYQPLAQQRLQFHILLKIDVAVCNQVKLVQHLALRAIPLFLGLLCGWFVMN